MKKKIFLIFSVLLFVSYSFALGQSANSELRFSRNGEFKIVQFTDVHYKYRNPASDAALRHIQKVLDAEKPDLVIFTGDIIYAAPADTAMRTVLETVSSRKIPFAVTFGNHDDEQGMTRTQLYDIIRSIPYNVQPDRSQAVSTDYTLSIKTSDGKKDAAVLYCLDSHSYSKLKDVKGYDWLTFDQVRWYRRQSESLKVKNGGKPLPALAFFHIPLPEFSLAESDPNTAFYGIRMEKSCSPQLNSGMFTAMKEGGDVMGIFVGHDHDDDYSAMWHGIVLAYGRFTGGNTEYNHLTPGARVIVLYENKCRFSTWIRESGKQIVCPTTYPDSYVKDDWKNRSLEKE